MRRSRPGLDRLTRIPLRRKDLDRRIAVEPMMDCADEVNKCRSINDLSRLKSVCGLYVASRKHLGDTAARATPASLRPRADTRSSSSGTHEAATRLFY
jgi:hypothetical protein